MSRSELPSDRLATTDAQGGRVYLYPTAVRGKWQRWRMIFGVLLVFVFLGLPWVKLGGHQALLFDIPQRRFAFFGVAFWAHDAPLLFLIVGGSALTLAAVTAVWGRAWCGWACPQTVFIEQVFRRVERWIEGDSFSQKKLDESAWGISKFSKKALKWGVFTLFSGVLSHSFLAYFIGTDALARMMAGSPSENPGSFFSMIGLTSLILFDLGWFREQFCTVLCPYGRFQSVLMDTHSRVVAYDTKRGEPRRGLVQEKSEGDCVNCFRCVQVCPTGIDIRRGVQLECIACTACMDACDDVMNRLKKPQGLIRYGNSALAEGRMEESPSVLRRFRFWIYLLLLSTCGSGLFYAVSHRLPIESTWIRAVDAPFQSLTGSKGEPRVLNHFKVDLRNQSFEKQSISFSVGPEWTAAGIELVVSNLPSTVLAGEPARADVFVLFSPDVLKSGKALVPLRFEAVSETGRRFENEQEVSLVGPIR